MTKGRNTPISRSRRRLTPGICATSSSTPPAMRWKVVQSGVQSGPSTSYSMGLDGKHTLESRNPDGTVLSHQEWGPMTGGPWSEGWKHNATALYRCCCGATLWLENTLVMYRAAGDGCEQCQATLDTGVGPWCNEPDINYVLAHAV